MAGLRAVGDVDAGSHPAGHHSAHVREKPLGLWRGRQEGREGGREGGGREGRVSRC